MSALTLQKLHQFAQHGHSEIFNAMLAAGDSILISNGINSPRRLKHFLGNCFVESAGFTSLEENLHYSASRLLAVFPRKFNAAMANRLASDGPEAIANYVYGNRMGNNSVGDGWRYRGSGLLQLTGKDNYTRLSKLTGIDLVNDPDQARDISTCFKVACMVWKALNCNLPADTDNYYVVRQRVNGGQNGAADVIAATKRAALIFVTAPSSYAGFISDYSDDDILEQQEPDTASPIPDLSVSATPLGGPAVPMTARQAKTIQGRLKAKNFNPGEIDGNIHSASTVGAIATLQKQYNLPVTGIVDDATEDAIQNSDVKVVSASREDETVDSLRAKGSQTIADADSVTNATHGIAAGGLGTIAAGATAILSEIKNQISSVRDTTDGLGITDKIVEYIQLHISTILLFVFGFFLLSIAYRLYNKSDAIKEERVRKSKTGEDMSH